MSSCHVTQEAAQHGRGQFEQRIDAHSLPARVWPNGANHVGGILANGLRALSTKHSMIGEVRGRGLAVSVDLVSDRVSREPVAVMTTAKIIYRAYTLGAVFFYVGMRGNVLELTPPLT